MQNRLGLPKDEVVDVERKLVNFKLNLLDETYTFNSDMFSINYLIKLNKFLFSDIYPEQNTRLRQLSKFDIDNISYLLYQVKKAAIHCDNENLIDSIKELWYFQIFADGNTRTLIAYIKILNDRFKLGLPIDVNSNIQSNPKTFRQISVNQKRLTASKKCAKI